jgi:hypothetical protein
MLAELYPQQTQHQLSQMLIRLELEGSADIRNMLSKESLTTQGDVS